MRLGTCLPLNLRQFLLAEFGSTLHIKEDAIYCPGPGELFVRELARAIRRFSFNRARERWAECTIAVARLESALRCPPRAGHGVVLCLRCERLSAGAQPAEHQGPRCLTLALNAATPSAAAQAPASDGTAKVHQGLYGVIEDFRLRRTIEGLPHFDLDYYVSSEQAVFTWRPLPPDESS